MTGLHQKNDEKYVDFGIKQFEYCFSLKYLFAIFSQNIFVIGKKNI